MSKIKNKYDATLKPTALAGSHQVVEFIQEGNHRNGDNTWNELRLVGDKATLVYANGCSFQCDYFANTLQKKIELYVHGTINDPEVFTYQIEHNGQLVLKGKHQETPVRIRLQKMKSEDFRLMKMRFSFFSQGPN